MHHHGNSWSLQQQQCSLQAMGQQRSPPQCQQQFAIFGAARSEPSSVTSPTGSRMQQLSVKIPDVMTDATSIEGESFLRLSPPLLHGQAAWPCAPTGDSMRQPQFISAHLACPWGQS